MIATNLFGEELALYQGEYSGFMDCPSLALGLASYDEPSGCVFSAGLVTVNAFEYPLGAYEVALDTNNSPTAVEMLLDMDIVAMTGKSVRSDRCEYPIAMVNPVALSQIGTFDEVARELIDKIDNGDAGGSVHGRVRLPWLDFENVPSDGTSGRGMGR